ncbi:MFS transporter [Agrobacterium rhizogenes]|uniref:MFS transporter n=1 Tax=Rhizobium rhizogenes TaxID=359 RepID=UPI0015746ED3|nr:MFS transporter [Rhizobium rhizogenes]NTH16776.1 MFS transporter [Rhizobium rhizogenes]
MGRNAAASRAGFYRYIILALITIVLAFSTGDRATLSVAGPGITGELGISKVQMGWIFSAFAWAYVLGQLPAGWLVDRLGAKKTVFYGLILWSVATFLAGFVTYVAFPFIALLCLRVLLGIFESPVGPASGRVIAAWFPSSERGVAGAIFNSAQYLSLAVFTPLMGWLNHMFGWEHIFTVMGGLGLLLAIFWWRMYFVPTKHPAVTKEELSYIRAGGGLVDLNPEDAAANAGSDGATATKVLSLFKNRMLVGIFLAQYCITAITWFFVSWFPTYLVEDLGLTILNAGFVASIPAVAGCIGGVSTGFFSDWLLKKTGSLSIARKTPITLGLLLTGAIILCNYTTSEFMVILLMSLAFFGKGFGSLGWTVVADTAPREIIGLTGGVFNAVGNSAGIVTPLVIGYLVAGSGSFASALLFVGLHGMVAILSYWIIVGPIKRAELQPAKTPSEATPFGSKADAGRM